MKPVLIQSDLLNDFASQINISGLIQVNAVRPVVAAAEADHGGVDGHGIETKHEYYCHLIGEDSRLDEWLLPNFFLRLDEPLVVVSTSKLRNGTVKAGSPETVPEDAIASEAKAGQKRKRERESKSVGRMAFFGACWRFDLNIALLYSRPH